MAEDKKTITISIKKSTIWKCTTILFAILLVISVYFNIQKFDGISLPTIGKGKGSSGEFNMKGDADAPVTIIEWSDFECPFCTRFYTQTLGQIEDTYISTGKVKLIYKDFPLGFHANAQKAGEAAKCAGAQDMFWEMHDKLFDEGVKGGVTAFKGFAADLGLDTKQFNTCLDSGMMAESVKKDMAEGQAAGITGTPGFTINGNVLSGAQPFDKFKEVIDAELAKTG